ncbi:hypothetical protein OHA79_33460 [Streptomyces sp. NBC_00841]|uniref:hypothetical protein n=1 Tax=unclassified Streptomyces TaxID=2593676 RepID=UPI0022596E2D|nr:MULTISPECIES: hypothetical protein [unclassified Streptomyces]MCX4532169.1 hypothetical protein [Streptomyces sp. NBC_01669]WSA02321.1 hypothetical protein OHA79_33460 [Streptomyces sp. NBC_00841]
MDLLLLDAPVNHVALGPVRELKKSPVSPAGALVVSRPALRRRFTGDIHRTGSGQLNELESI